MKKLLFRGRASVVGVSAFWRHATYRLVVMLHRTTGIKTPWESIGWQRYLEAADYPISPMA